LARERQRKEEGGSSGIREGQRREEEYRARIYASAGPSMRGGTPVLDNAMADT
jgi:hypothetical protein